MAKLLWDGQGERFYETGLDRGVLYLSDRSGLPWNGLISVDEDQNSDTSTPVYFDGVKYLDIPQHGDYEATIIAYTYPDEFLEYEGVEDLGNGLLIDGQESKLFGLSYRTFVADDLSGIDCGYKIHILYNLTVVQNTVDYETLNKAPNLTTFDWKISGAPETLSGYRPTAHIVLDSRYLNPAILSALEDTLYGAADSEANLPTLVDLLNFVINWDPKQIVPNDITGLAQLVDGMGDLTQINLAGIFAALPSTTLTASDVEGLYTLV